MRFGGVIVEQAAQPAVDEDLHRADVAELGKQLAHAKVVVKDGDLLGAPVAICIFRPSCACPYERGKSGALDTGCVQALGTGRSPEAEAVRQVLNRRTAGEVAIQQGSAASGSQAPAVNNW